MYNSKMRRSARQQDGTHSKVKKRWSFWRKYAFTILIITSLISLSALFLAYSEWRQTTTAKIRQAAQSKEFAELEKRVRATIQNKIDTAKKAEAAAKAQAAIDAAARKTQAVVNPLGAKASVVCDVKNPALLSVVINKKHCFNPIDWAPSDLDSVAGYAVRSEAAIHLNDMMNAAATAGFGLEPSSAYRSYVNQITTYNNWVTVNGSQAAADTVSARPGYSEHQTGLAVDLKAGSCALECFGGTGHYQWLVLHAWEYGYIERYPPGLTSITGYSPEAWHWRYIGSVAAADMKAKGIQTLEEYYGISGGDYAG